MKGARLLPLLVLLSLACFVMANNETLPEYKQSNENDQSDYSTSEIDQRLLKLATQEEDTEEWRRKFKKISKELAKKMANHDAPDKNDKKYNNQSINELNDAASKDKLITAVRTKLTAFSGPLSSRAKDSLSSLNQKWYTLSDDSKKGALNTLGVISSNIEVFGNAGEDPVGAIRGAIDIVASISSNFGPKGQLASVALGFVSALLGLFGKGPKKPKPLGQIVREQIDDALAEYREEKLIANKHSMLMAFRLTKAYLDGAASTGKPLRNHEVQATNTRVQSTVGKKFIGYLVGLISEMFKKNKDSRKAIRYCEIFAQLAFYRDIILTQFIDMHPLNNGTWHSAVEGRKNERDAFRRIARVLLGKLYEVNFDNVIIPYFDPEVSVITDALSTKLLNLGKYDRSMAGLHCLMTPGRNGALEDLDWQRGDKPFRPSGYPYVTTVMPHIGNFCYWKLIPHPGNVYTILNMHQCKRNWDYCGSMLSWTEVNGKAYADLNSADPVLWEIQGNDWKFIRNKQGCGRKMRSKWCNYDLRVQNRKITIIGRPSRFFWLKRPRHTKIKRVGQLVRPDGKHYWKTRKARDD